MTGTSKVALWWIDEVQPTLHYTGDDGWGGPTDTKVTFDDPDLTEAAIAALTKLADEPDSRGCEAQGCEVGRPGAHPAGIGYVLEENEDHPHLSGCFWHWVTVVYTPDDKVVLVCEDCSPGTIYYKP